MCAVAFFRSFKFLDSKMISTSDDVGPPFAPILTDFTPAGLPYFFCQIFEKAPGLTSLP